MGNHRQAQRGLRRRRRAAFLAGTMLLAGMVALLVAVVRADVTPSALGPAPAAASPATAAESAAQTAAATAVPTPAGQAAPGRTPAGQTPGAPGGRFDGTWTGRLSDPDTTTVDVRLVVDGAGPGVRLDVPALGCTYRGPAPVPGTPGTATADLRAEGDASSSCVESARVRLAAEGGAAGPRAERVRYDLVASCVEEQCVPRRATGVLAPR